MSDPKLIHSALSCTIREDGTEVRINICKLETTDWSLEVVDETGTSTVWDGLFLTDQAALDEALKTIREEGIRTFLSGEFLRLDFDRRLMLQFRTQCRRIVA